MAGTYARGLAAGGVSLAALAAAVWAATASKPAAVPVAVANTPISPPDDNKPIPVRPDTEPYRPYALRWTTDQSISVYMQRVQRDPQDFISYTTLGGLYLRRAKETGDHSAYDKADEAFQTALAKFKHHAPAKLGRAAVANFRHKFADSFALAKAVYDDNPDAPEALEALVAMADARQELGQYAEAEATLAQVMKKIEGTPSPALVARQARLAELKGDVPTAVALLNKAVEIETADEATAVSLSWYAARLGEIHLTAGKPDEAAKQLDAAVKANPTSPDLKVMLAKVRLAQGKAADAVAIMEQVVAVDQDVDTWLPYGDALTAAGDPAKAAVQYAKADQKADKEMPHGVRELILHYCDTGKRLEKALALARADWDGRKDVFTCDSLAWALLKNGKVSEAEKLSAEALRLGTRDAVLLYHAGVIAFEGGKLDKAKELLARALEVNPHFAQVKVAKELLAELG